MGTLISKAGTYMHNQGDSVLADWPQAEPFDVDKQFIVQEREVSYRFSLFQHPFVGRLMQRLLARDAAALLAADTDYDLNGKVRPDSVEIELDGSVELTIPGGARVALLEGVTVTAGGAQTDLAASLTVTLGFSKPTTARVAAPPSAPGEPPSAAIMRAVLIGGLDAVETPGSIFTPSLGSQAVVIGNTLITLTAPAPILLPIGGETELPAGTELALADGVVLTVPDGAAVRLIRSKPRPILFADALAHYQPTALVRRPFAVKDLDFSIGGTYSVFNWELFYHVPLTIAMHLSKNGRYAESQHWFHYLFDPTDSSDGPTPERFWKVLPFQTTDVHKIEEVLINLVTGADPELREETIQSINAWKNAPFRPHVIARYRQGAYMHKTVMAYLDNLIAWGDSLFRQDTGEAIDEALMLYVLAANILGPRPEEVPATVSVKPQTYYSLREDLRHFGTVVTEFETIVPFDVAPLSEADTGDGSAMAMLRGLGKALYFCTPRNDKLVGYWDTVADRLFKIHNSLNIQGVFRQLALFEPPIDPALLARAAAAGLDVGAIVNGLHQPLPLVRFQLLVQKANEIVHEVKSLGNNLLSAMEKEDGEALALLRARHERAIMAMVEVAKYAQLQETSKAREALLSSLALAVHRYTYYELQLGRSLQDIEKDIPKLDDLDENSFNQMKLKMAEPTLSLRELEVNVVTGMDLVFGKLMSSYEVAESAILEAAQLATDLIGVINLFSSSAHLTPTLHINTMPMGIGSTTEFGGSSVGRAADKNADAVGAVVARLNFEARRMARMGDFDRRAGDWTFQRNLAAGEINQIFKQLRAAQLREAIADLELRNHRKQMEHAAEIERFLNAEGTEKGGKVTNKALYTFIKREVKGLYAQCFQFAFNIAKKAERALQHELGDPSLTYLQFGYLAGKEGLLAGEKLYFDLKRMEMAYLELNRREYELTKHVSLLQVAPLALIELRATGHCTVRLPEELFDMDGPGHYFRRIKSVAVSIPCITGPYASVNCTLTLLNSSIRTTPDVANDYARVEGEDSRFSDYFGSLQSIVTSSAQNDSGLFETNLRDERYLPFENSGVISEWQLQLPANPSNGDPRQFDYDTISDVILHIRYSAREGGGPLRREAIQRSIDLFAEARGVGSVRLFSMRHEFPSEWAKFQAQTAEPRELTFTLRPEHFPFWSKGRQINIGRVDAIARSSEETAPATIVVSLEGTAETDSLTKRADFNDLLIGELVKTAPAVKPPNKSQLGETRLRFDKPLSDLWLAVQWSG